MTSDAAAKTSDRNSNAPKGQRSPGPTCKAAALNAQLESFKLLDREDTSSSLPASMDESSPQSTDETLAETTLPSFHGNFDLYAMELPFLNSAFIPERDYAALLKVLRTYQAKPDNTAQIFLPEHTSTGAAGRFESLNVLDPLQEWPFDLALRSLTLKDSVTFTARETSDAAQYFSDPPKAKVAGVTAAVALTRDQCGISSSKGTFKMRRAWVSEDGKDEVFEGVFSMSIVYSSLYREKCDETACREAFAFWAIRARVGEDGKEIGLGAGAGRRW